MGRGGVGVTENWGKRESERVRAENERVREES